MKRRTLLQAALFAPATPFFERCSIMSAAPLTADGFYQTFQDKNDLIWSGGDQVTSFKYNGFTYWSFGDTMLSNGENPDGSYPTGAEMVSNHILLQTGDQFTNAIANAGSGSAGNAVPDAVTYTTINKRRYWAQGMFSANGYLYVLAQRVEADPNNSSGFKLKGVELAKFSQNTTTGLLTLKAMISTPCTGVDGGTGPLAVQWGDEAVIDTGYVYVYGTALAEGNAFVAHFSYVARVPTAQVENPYAWRFYAKSSGTWKTSMADMNQDVTNQPDAILAGQVSSVRYINSKYVMLHKPWNGLGSDVKALYAFTPFEWNQANEFTIFSSPAGTTPGGQNYQTYSPQLHPEQSLTSGKTLVSIAWNGSTLADTMADADLYKPRFYEIQF